MAMQGHSFGGAWTEIKLDVLDEYLTAYTTALKGKFNLLYIDAFAGSGKFTPKDGVERDGSALRALKNGKFDAYVFFEEDPSRAESLRSICDGEYPNLKSTVVCGDANQLMAEFIRRFPAKDWRYVVFLDPYGMTVDWSTLKTLSEARVADVWYLFPISGLCRNAPRKLSCTDKSKEDSLDRILGTPDWRDAFYVEAAQKDLFGDPEIIRDKDIRDLERFVEDRLSSLFPLVQPPIRLPKSGSQLYSLFFAISSPSKTAQHLAKRITGHIIKNA